MPPPNHAPHRAGLRELALNLRWSWNHSTDELWRQLNRDLWDSTQNPWLVLQTVSDEKRQEALDDPHFRDRIDELLHEQQSARQDERWFQRNHAHSPLTLAAYFSMEYMLCEALPIYSGGLGNVAGDQLKAASDLGVPVVGVGLLYQQGYFRQEFDRHGNQQALYPFNDPGQLPIQPLRQSNGEWLRFAVNMPGIKLWLRVWHVQVGRRTLYLLDTNDPANPPLHRCINSELYGGGPELRIRQEVVLGIGGWRLLRLLGLQPQVLHLNEGHAAFAALERARGYMEDHQQPFDDALAITRAGNLFTTHTAVDAGFDRFDPTLVRQYLCRYAEHGLRVPFEQLLAMGRRDTNNSSEPFNMAFLAMHAAGSVNGVSRLHGEVSRGLFSPLFPRWPVDEVPVTHVTNGVHVPTWESPEAHALWDELCGESRWLEDLQSMESAFRKATDEQLWALRTMSTRHLIEFARRRLARQRAIEGAAVHEVIDAERIFDEKILTLGFARRFATYKRPALLLHDPDRLLRILNHEQRPVQLILAGKAHPQDTAGQAIVRQWNDFARRPEARSRVIFLSDYDMQLTQQLSHGADLWVNTPRRPWEACGTSGMKVLVNGGLNLSECDGWWAEAYRSEFGWSLNPSSDEAEADALYRVLESEVVPAFYDRNSSGLPPGWIAKMRESMALLTPQYSANRAVREYTETRYLPAAQAYADRAADAGAALLTWHRDLHAHWQELKFGSVSVYTHAGTHRFTVEVHLGEMPPSAVSIELFANPGLRIPMSPADPPYYAAEVSADRPVNDYTPRIVPSRPGVNVPLEAQQILWQR